MAVVIFCPFNEHIATSFFRKTRLSHYDSHKRCCASTFQCVTVVSFLLRNAMANEIEFSWADADSVVIERTEAIAVYPNPKGDVVIRQEKQMGDEDSVVIVPRGRLGDLIAALQNEVII